VGSNCENGYFSHSGASAFSKLRSPVMCTLTLEITQFILSFTSCIPLSRLPSGAEGETRNSVPVILNGLTISGAWPCTGSSFVSRYINSKLQILTILLRTITASLISVVNTISVIRDRKAVCRCGS